VCSVLCAVILSERTTGSEATRWSSSFQVRRLWMQDRAARLGTMGQAAILPPDLGVFPFFLSFSFFRIPNSNEVRSNERTNYFFPRLDQALGHRRRALSGRSPRCFRIGVATNSRRPRVGGGSGQRGGYGMATSPPGWCGGLGYLDAREIYVARGQWTRRLVEPGGSLNTQPV